MPAALVVSNRKHDRCLRRASTRFLPSHPKVETVKHESENRTVTAMDVEALLGTLSRLPDVEADNLQAFDATDRLLLDTAADLLGPDTKVCHWRPLWRSDIGHLGWARRRACAR